MRVASFHRRPRVAQQPPGVVVRQSCKRLLEGQPLFRAAVGAGRFGTGADQKIPDAIAGAAPGELERLAGLSEKLAVDARFFARLAERRHLRRLTRLDVTLGKNPVAVFLLGGDEQDRDAAIVPAKHDPARLLDRTQRAIDSAARWRWRPASSFAPPPAAGNPRRRARRC